jgi:hypothetical protein
MFNIFDILCYPLLSFVILCYPLSPFVGLRVTKAQGDKGSPGYSFPSR